MFTKTQIEIMKTLVSRIRDRFSIKQISELTKKPYPLTHRSVKILIEGKFIIKDEKELLSLNYKDNIMGLAYLESLRKNELLSKDKTLSLFVRDVLEKIGIDFFVFALFGSSVEKRSPRDVDILLIIENKDKSGEVEKILNNIASNFSRNFDINVISAESAYEMLGRRDDVNVMNETLNKHILLFGAENYYRMLKNAR